MSRPSSSSSQKRSLAFRYTDSSTISRARVTRTASSSTASEREQWWSAREISVISKAPSAKGSRAPS
ncbi:MAG: hypothetical protein A3F92_14805 [Candidatus Rokubacteria bacterium RIFCSPLOWO2_12_FULL_71_22]|nr:MAG: hypothetical protein A3F92_14805 [Candidatus Rokubacteria bacterium RIFCSPLOWO2_12_FULL_71_22]